MGSEWAQTTVGAAAHRVTKGTTPTTIGGRFSESGIAFIKVESITEDGRFLPSKFAFIDEDTNQLLERSVLQENDVLFTIAGTIGRVAKVDASILPANTNQAVAIIRPNQAVVDPRFLYYALRDDQRVLNAKTRVVQSVQANFSLSELSEVELPLPCKKIQRAIAHILGTLDDKIELNRRMSETLEAMARALFKSWFVDFDPVRAKMEGRWRKGESLPGLPADLWEVFPDRLADSELGEIPEGWEVKVLDDLARIAISGDWGVDEPSINHTERARCIRGADIPDLQAGGIGKMPVRYLKPASLAKRRLSDGDLVIEISGGSPTQSTGRPVLVSDRLLQRLDVPLVCSNFCRLVKLKTHAYSKFVYLWLRALYSADEFLQFENGTTGIKNFAFTLFSSQYKLYSPTDNVLVAFNEHIAPVFVRKQSAAAEADILATLRDTLLPKLISGEIRVKDADKFVERAV